MRGGFTRAEEGGGGEDQNGGIYEAGQCQGKGRIDRCQPDALGHCIHMLLPAPTRHIAGLYNAAVQVKVVRHHSRAQDAHR